MYLVFCSVCSFISVAVNVMSETSSSVRGDDPDEEETSSSETSSSASVDDGGDEEQPGEDRSRSMLRKGAGGARGGGMEKGEAGLARGAVVARKRVMDDGGGGGIGVNGWKDVEGVEYVGGGVIASAVRPDADREQVAAFMAAMNPKRVKVDPRERQASAQNKYRKKLKAEKECTGRMVRILAVLSQGVKELGSGFPTVLTDDNVPGIGDDGVKSFAKMKEALKGFCVDESCKIDYLQRLHRSVDMRLSGNKSSRWHGEKEIKFHNGWEDGVDGGKQITFVDSSYCMAFFVMYNLADLVALAKQKNKNHKINMWFTTSYSMQKLACETDDLVREEVLDILGDQVDLVFSPSSHIGKRCEGNKSARHNVFGMRHTRAVLDMCGTDLLRRGVATYPPLSLLHMLSQKPVRDAILDSNMLKSKVITEEELKNVRWMDVANNGHDLTYDSMTSNGYICKTYPGAYGCNGVFNLKKNQSGNWVAVNFGGVEMKQPGELGMGDIRMEPFIDEFRKCEWRFFAQLKGAHPSILYVVRTVSLDGNDAGAIACDAIYNGNSLYTDSEDVHHRTIFSRGKEMVGKIFETLKTSRRGRLHSFCQEGITFRSSHTPSNLRIHLLLNI